MNLQAGRQQASSAQALSPGMAASLRHSVWWFPKWGGGGGEGGNHHIGVPIIREAYYLGSILGVALKNCLPKGRHCARVVKPKRAKTSIVSLVT